MANLTAPIPTQQQPTSSSKKSTPQRGRDAAQSKTPKPFLPEALRRPLAARLDAVLAHPLAARCAEPCRICDAVSDDIADAILARWDAMARTGTWPIRGSQIRADLQATSIVLTLTPLNKIISHRRWRVIDLLVREDLTTYERQRAEETLPTPDVR